ncbi:histidinol-phosphate transaminase [Gephyromycinifex aptenodytis]|uniref:histidinol-phosphate transaminase n=1 Tax=Gephyromycinifex aptenodytis TaxID=2716227 RepID=UPI0014485AD2|nr:histidinol-phosphate transaminase [Gephyromycinifex aptenodytis]
MTGDPRLAESALRSTTGGEQPPQVARVRTRDALHVVPAYKPGKPPTRVEGVTPYKMSSNENPFPPLPGVVEVVAAAAAEMNRYPDMATTALRARIAEHVGVSPQEIVTGTGSTGVLGYLVTATCEAGDEVIYAWRSFEAYPILVALSGARSVQVPLTAGEGHDLPAMAEAITANTRLILVCNPNNPTGTAISARELEDFLAQVPPHVLVVLDEAYVEFCTDEDRPDGLEFYRDHPNLVVLRTFSKAYGLAGMRVGYAIAHPPVADVLRKCVLPFGVSDMASRAAIASLDARDELLERVATLVAERERLAAELVAQGWDVPHTQANFVWLPLREHASAFAAAAEAEGLSVRAFEGEGVRCSIDAPEANERLLRVAGAFRSQLG